MRRLKATFEAVAQGDRVVLNRVIREWLASGDDRDRYDGAWQTDELGLAENLGVIQGLRDEAERRCDPAAPFDWSKYNEIAGRLASKS